MAGPKRSFSNRAITKRCQARTPDEVLDGLREDFETLYLAMQGGRSLKAVDSLLSASAEDFNKTAAERTRRRG
jgi:hypothetical protein